MKLPNSMDEIKTDAYLLTRLLGTMDGEFVTALKETYERFKHLKSMILVPEQLYFVPTRTPRAKAKEIYLVKAYAGKKFIDVKMNVINYTMVSDSNNYDIKELEEYINIDMGSGIIRSGKDFVPLRCVFPGNLIHHNVLSKKNYSWFTTERERLMDALFYDRADAIKYMGEVLLYMEEQGFIPEAERRTDGEA